MAGSTVIQTGYAPVFHGELYYEVIGQGHPLLLIHAGVADCQMWDAQLDEFARRFRVIRYDTRGYGRSRTEDTSFSNRQDILDLLDHLGVEKTHLIGVSRGGHIAIDFTLEHPERISALIPVSAGVGGYEHQPDGSEKARIETQLFDTMDELWEQNKWEQLNEMEVQMWADGPGQPAGRAAPHVRENVRQMNANNLRRQDGKPIPQPLEPPAIGRLSEIKAPCLVIVGDLDTTDTLVMADIMTQGIPHARKLVFPGAAHMLSLEQPEKFNREVICFLEGLDT
jgi:pimeloyl-ACP methyl ester carboxylesterase